MPVTWSDEKLILLYCPGRGSNSRPSAHRGFKHGQGVPRPYSLGHGGGKEVFCLVKQTQTYGFVGEPYNIPAMNEQFRNSSH